MIEGFSLVFLLTSEVMPPLPLSNPPPQSPPQFDFRPNEGVVVIALEEQDGLTLDRVLALGEQRVCCQLAAVSPGAIRELLGHELAVTRRALFRPRFGSKHDPRWGREEADRGRVREMHTHTHTLSLSSLSPR